MRTFQVARTSRPATLTLDAARASDYSSACNYIGIDCALVALDVPLAFFLDITDARMNMGLLRTVPGSAKIVHTASKPTR
jgi:hypothetical protein